MSKTEEEQYQKSNERVEIPTRFSVAMLVEKDLEKSGPSLLLVRQTKSKLWGPPAGGLKLNVYGVKETPKEAMSRELGEEAWLALDVGYWERQPKGIGLVDVHGNSYPRLGFIYRGKLLKSMRYSWPNYKPRFETDAWMFAEPEKIGKLISNAKIYKPEINIPLMQWWIGHRRNIKACIFLQLQGGDKK